MTRVVKRPTWQLPEQSPAPSPGFQSEDKIPNDGFRRIYQNKNGSERVHYGLDSWGIQIGLSE